MELRREPLDRLAGIALALAVKADQHGAESEIIKHFGKKNRRIGPVAPNPPFELSQKSSGTGSP